MENNKNKEIVDNKNVNNNNENPNENTNENENHNENHNENNNENHNELVNSEDITLKPHINLSKKGITFNPIDNLIVEINENITDRMNSSLLSVGNPEEREKMREISDTKFPTYDDKIIDTELRYEVTIDSLYSDIYSSINLLIEFEKVYGEFITGDKKAIIIDGFKKHSLNYLIFKLYPTLLRRQLTLISHLLKIKDRFSNQESRSIFLFPNR